MTELGFEWFLGLLLLVRGCNGNQVGSSYRNDTPLSPSHRICQEHWLGHASPFFEKYKRRVEQIVEASAPSPVIASGIFWELNRTSTKLAFLTSFAKGKDLGSPSQELWARGILRSYLNQATSSVLDNIGSFPIGTQVLLIKQCTDMVDALAFNLTQHALLCSRRNLPQLEHRHINAAICLSVDRTVETTNRSMTPGAPWKGTFLGNDPLALFPKNCEDLWTPLTDLRGAAVRVLESLLDQTRIPLPNADSLIADLQNKQNAFNLFTLQLRTGNHSLRKSGKPALEWVLWKRQRLTEISSDTASVLDSVSDRLNPTIRTFIKEKCEIYNSAVRVVSVVEAKCLNIHVPPPDNNKDGLCWLSNKAVGGVAVAPRAAVGGGIQLFPPPKSCRDLWKPVKDTKITALQIVVALIEENKDLLPNAAEITAALKDKQTAFFNAVSDMWTSETSLSERRKSPTEWVTRKRQQLTALEGVIASVLDPVFDSLNPDIRTLLKNKCDLHNLAVRASSIVEAKCLNINLPPIELGKQKLCWLSNKAVGGTMGQLGAVVPEVGPRAGSDYPTPDQLLPPTCQDLWTPMKDIKMAAFESVINGLTHHPNATSIIADLKNKHATFSTFASQLSSGSHSLRHSGKEPYDWVLWKRQKFQDHGKDISTVLDSVYEDLSPEMQTLLEERCHVHNSAIRVISTLEAKCHGVELEPTDLKNKKVCWLSNKAVGGEPAAEFGARALGADIIPKPSDARKLLPQFLCPLANLTQIWRPVILFREETDKVVADLIKANPDSAIQSGLLAKLAEKLHAHSLFINSLKNGEFDKIKKTKTPRDWVLWTRAKSKELNKETGALIDSFLEKLGLDARKLFKEKCLLHHEMIRGMSILQAKCLGIDDIEPAGQNSTGCWLSNAVGNEILPGSQ